MHTKDLAAAIGLSFEETELKVCLYTLTRLKDVFDKASSIQEQDRLAESLTTELDIPSQFEKGEASHYSFAFDRQCYELQKLAVFIESTGCVMGELGWAETPDLTNPVWRETYGPGNAHVAAVDLHKCGILGAELHTIRSLVESGECTLTQGGLHGYHASEGRNRMRIHQDGRHVKGGTTSHVSVTDQGISLFTIGDLEMSARNPGSDDTEYFTRSSFMTFTMVKRARERVYHGVTAGETTLGGISIVCNLVGADDGIHRYARRLLVRDTLQIMLFVTKKLMDNGDLRCFTEPASKLPHLIDSNWRSALGGIVSRDAKLGIHAWTDAQRAEHTRKMMAASKGIFGLSAKEMRANAIRAVHRNWANDKSECKAATRIMEITSVKIGDSAKIFFHNASADTFVASLRTPTNAPGIWHEKVVELILREIPDLKMEILPQSLHVDKTLCVDWKRLVLENKFGKRRSPSWNLWRKLVCSNKFVFKDINVRGIHMTTENSCRSPSPMFSLEEYKLVQRQYSANQYRVIYYYINANDASGIRFVVSNSIEMKGNRERWTVLAEGKVRLLKFVRQHAKCFKNDKDIICNALSESNLYLPDVNATMWEAGFAEKSIQRRIGGYCWVKMCKTGIFVECDDDRYEADIRP